MEPLREHPYACALIAAGVLVTVGAFIVESRTPVELSGDTIAWQGGASISTSTMDEPATEAPSPAQSTQPITQNQTSATFTLPTLAGGTAATTSYQPTSDSFDYVALLKDLSTPSKARAASSTADDSGSGAIAEAYQFIPTGLIATSATSGPRMSAAQEALYEYGNEVGGEIKGFEALHTNEAQILKDQAEDRTDPAKAAALVSLGKSLASVGTFMQGMQNVPDSVLPLHKALAESYVDIGGKLQLVASAQSDQDFVQAIETYDDAANTYVDNYAALAEFFSAQGVVFSSGDPGNVFSFSATGGGL